jgi:CheY-like chemotaxis protein
LRVLIAEDEADVLLCYKMALEYRGHNVITAENGEKCVRRYSQEFNKATKLTKGISYDDNDNVSYKSDVIPFDVVILDYRMPKKDGLEAAREILEIDPHQRIIFASAYVKETLEQSVNQLKRVVELLQKPFSIEAFVDTVEDIEAYKGLKQMMANIIKMNNLKGTIQETSPTREQIKDLFEGLRKIQKYRTF